MTTPTITRLKLPAVRHAIASTPWAIHPERGKQLLAYLEARATGQLVASEAPKPRAAEPRRPITKSGGAIAVLPMYGVIAQRMDLMMAYCGGTSAERFADEFDAAIADPNVSAIVIDCDSPGGNVTGTPELAKRIFNARGKGKKLVAVSNGMMCSAAYWICCACDEVYASPSSDTGSIGVFCVHLDETGLNEQLGLKYTVIRFGEHKAELNPWETPSAEAFAFVQGQVDELGDMFHKAVSKYRGISLKRVAEQFGQGRSFTASQALEAGLVDGVMTLEETLNKLGARDVGMSGRPRRAMGTAAATLDDRGRVVPPTLVGMRADGEPETAPDEQTCPQCESALGDDGKCTGDTCDYTSASADDKPENEDTSASAVGAAARETVSPDNRPDEALEQPVSQATTAANGAAANDEVLKAERTRASAIRKLGQKFRVGEEQIEAMINEGLTVDQASARVLSHVEAKGAAAPVIIVGADREADKPFESAGEQLVAIVQRTKHGKRDARLDRVNYNARQLDTTGFSEVMAGSPSGMNESVGSEGGFFIAPEVLPDILKPVYEDDPILSRVKRIPIGSTTNRTVYNVVDESARTDGNRWGGIQFIWGDEADQGTPKKPKMRQLEQLLKKLIGLGYLTDEMTQDAPAAQTLLLEAFQTELRFVVANEVFRGPGGGRMLGFLKGKGGVVQAIEATQTIANTAQFISQNIAKMKANIPASLWGDLIWLYNQELYPYLINATLGGTNVPAFVPAGGVGNMGNVDRILGAPAFASELCEQPGTPGDITVIAPSQYHLAEKGGVQVATSLHVKFLTDEMTLRITYRVDGKPVWNTTVAPFKGATARGFYSTLNTRA